MHISLDSALGRQRRLNSVGESVFQIAPNPSAGYSLRSLTGGDPAVVRVRRASDNSEKDFNSSGVSSGELVNWVNAQVVPPLDVRELVDGERTGALIPAAAAYSLRNLSASYTGDVVDVRRSSDDTEDSFTAAEVADGTLLAFVNLDDAYKGKAFLNNNSNAKVTFSSSYAMLASNNWSIKFTMILGKESGSGFGILGDTTNNSLFVDTNRKNMGFTDAAGNFVNIFPTGANPNAGQPIQVELFNTVGSGVAVKFDGVTVSSASAVGDFTFNTLGSARGRNQERVIFDLEIDLNGDGTVDHKYAGDGNQNSNWVDQKGNSNGTVSGAVTDYNNEFTDGFVTQWYDQSGNANHATQGTDARQPKIVDAGTLVSGGLDFDGVDDFLELGNLGLSQPNSVVFVHNSDTTSGSNDFLDGTTVSSGRTLIDQVSAFYRIFAGGDPTGTSKTIVANQDALVFTTLNGSSSEFALDGSNETALNAGTNGMDEMTLGASISGGRYDGTFAEFIIYNSDQSANRTAFEANIGETYGIDLPSGVDTGYDQVDGFVETWYDQSGNGNDAVQATAGSQPKIVDAGVLVAGGLDFNGVDDQLDFTALNATDLAIFSVVQFDSVSGQERILGEDSSNSEGFGIGNATNGFFRANGGSATQPALNATVSTSGTFLYSANRASNTLGFFTQGVASATATNSDAFNANSIGGSTNPVDGKIQEIIIYNSDQSDNRTAFEANIGETYNIDLPSGVDTGYDEVDGFVETWYDQSGNGNDAVQATAGSQPKIVDAGVLVTGGLDFDGVDDKLSFDSSVSLSTNDFYFASVISILDGDREDITPVGNAAGNRFLINLDYDNDTAQMRADDGTFLTQSFTRGVPANETLISISTVSNTATLRCETISAAVFDTTGESFTLGSMGQINPSTYSKHSIKEIIIYDSDQSANRAAIETNINNQYDIY